MNDIKDIFAKNLSELRQASGMTQLELGERLNYSDKTVSKWERGESIPDAGMLKQIADVFGVSVDYLLEEDHEKAAVYTADLPDDDAVYTKHMTIRRIVQAGVSGSCRSSSSSCAGSSPGTSTGSSSSGRCPSASCSASSSRPCGAATRGETTTSSSPCSS